MNEVRLIDANAYAAEMKVRQDACKEIMDAAKEDDNWEMYDRMSAKFSIFVEAKLTLDAMPTVDAVTVRCNDCKWFQSGIDIDGKPFTRCNGSVRTYGHTAPDWFCADGKRKEQSDG